MADSRVHQRSRQARCGLLPAVVGRTPPLDVHAELKAETVERLDNVLNSHLADATHEVKLLRGDLNDIAKILRRRTTHRRTIVVFERPKLPSVVTQKTIDGVPGKSRHFSYRPIEQLVKFLSHHFFRNRAFARLQKR